MQTHIVTVGFDYDYDAAFKQAFATTNATDSTPRRNSGGSAGPVRTSETEVVNPFDVTSNT